MQILKQNDDAMSQLLITVVCVCFVLNVVPHEYTER